VRFTLRRSHADQFIAARQHVKSGKHFYRELSARDQSDSNSNSEKSRLSTGTRTVWATVREKTEAELLRPVDIENTSHQIVIIYTITCRCYTCLATGINIHTCFSIGRRPMCNTSLVKLSRLIDWLIHVRVSTITAIWTVGHILKCIPTNGYRFTALSLPWWTPIQVLTGLGVTCRTLVGSLAPWPS